MNSDTALPSGKGLLHISAPDSVTYASEAVTLMWDSPPEQTPPIEGYFLYTELVIGTPYKKEQLPLVNEVTVYVPIGTTMHFHLTSFYTVEEEFVESGPTNIVSVTGGEDIPPEQSTSRPFMEITTVMGATFLDANDTYHTFNELLRFYSPTVPAVSRMQQRRFLISHENAPRKRV